MPDIAATRARINTFAIGIADRTSRTSTVEAAMDAVDAYAQHIAVRTADGTLTASFPDNVLMPRVFYVACGAVKDQLASAALLSPSDLAAFETAAADWRRTTEAMLGLTMEDARDTYTLITNDAGLLALFS